MSTEPAQDKVGELRSLIARVRELDEKATPGPLVAENLEADYGHRRTYWVSTKGMSIATIIVVKGDEEHVEAIWRFADAEAFAEYRTAAPTLAKVCEQLLIE